MATHDLPDHLPEIAPPSAPSVPVNALAVYRAFLVDRARLARNPDVKLAYEKAANRLNAVDAAVAELLHDARIAARTMEESDYAMNRAKGRRLSASIARVGGSA